MSDMTLAALWERVHERAPALIPGPAPADLAALQKIVVGRVDHDSRVVAPGSAFACVPGAVVDGHEFAARAVTAGAVALITEREVVAAESVPQIRVPSVRLALPWFASTIVGEPSSVLSVVGLTGTNGKTTIAHLLRSIAETAGVSAQVIGTLTGARTTPEATDLQRMLADFRDHGIALVAMEVSSHALDQHRADAIDFDVAVFTNLTPDHLDYHETMERYFAAKKMLFDGRSAVAIVNVDDAWGQRLAEELSDPRTAPPGTDVVRYSLHDVVIVDLAPHQSRFVWREMDVTLPLAGRFNIANAIAAAEAALALGYTPEVIAAGLSGVAAIPGRMEVVIAPSPDNPCVIVDYAHTPDGLRQVVDTCTALIGAAGRLLIVFGAGGDRDRPKRPLMGAACDAAAIAFVTSDNPRGEDPQAIVDEVLPGFSGNGAQVVVELDRRRAIALALDEARPGDMVVIAGKGHESTQTIAGVAHEFLDRTVALEEHARLPR